MMPQHYGCLDYWSLGRVAPRDRLREPWPRRFRWASPGRLPWTYSRETAGGSAVVYLRLSAAWSDRQPLAAAVPATPSLPARHGSALLLPATPD